MTASAEFSYLDPSLIVVDRPARQRRELTAIDELAESIRNIGLINPLIIQRDLTLVAGERRLTACLQIGLTSIPVRYVEDMSPLELHLIELEENVKRVDLPWADHVAAVAEYHRLLKAEHPDWTLDDTASRLGVNKSLVSKYMLVSDHMEHELVGGADKFSTALNAAQRIKERRAADTGREVAAAIEESLTLPSTDDEPRPAPAAAAPAPMPALIQTGSFLEWAPAYSGPKFNLIHCDFPYGVGVGDRSGQSARGATGSYEDTPEVYFELLRCFTDTQDRWLAESAHLIFWFSMDFYTTTRSLLVDAGWNVSAFPLIWHKSDNSGILPDPNRGPRRTYETAFFASRGDRKVVRAVANSYAGPTTRELHTSEKPRPMLTHFLRMVCDDSSRMLDPTCGSGNSVRVAYELGAASALGLELNPEYAEAARGNLANA